MTFIDLMMLVNGEGIANDAEILRVARPSEASADAVVFATDVVALEEAFASTAGAILAPEKLVAMHVRVDARVLIVEDARYAFALAAQHLRRVDDATEIHPSAVIGDEVVLGHGSRIGPHAVIRRGVHLGAQCSIGANVTIYEGTVLGDRVTVQSGAVLGSTGFGYARDPQTGRYLLFPQQGTLIVEDDVEIGANTTIDRGALGETRIGRGTKIDNLVHIGHNCTIGEDVIIAAQTGISGSSVVQDGAILGGQVGVGEHATIGRGVILGGGAGVLSGKKMQGAGQIFWGRPARPLKSYLRGLASFAEAARLRGKKKE